MTHVEEQAEKKTKAPLPGNERGFSNISLTASAACGVSGSTDSRVGPAGMPILFSTCFNTEGSVPREKALRRSKTALRPLGAGEISVTPVLVDRNQHLREHVGRCGDRPFPAGHKRWQNQGTRPGEQGEVGGRNLQILLNVVEASTAILDADDIRQGRELRDRLRRQRVRGSRRDII